MKFHPSGRKKTRILSGDDYSVQKILYKNGIKKKGSCGGERGVETNLDM